MTFLHLFIVVSYLFIAGVSVCLVHCCLQCLEEFDTQQALNERLLNE